MKFVLGGRSFPSKRAAREAVRALLYAYPLGATIAGDEENLLLFDALQRLEHAEEKMGVGVVSFQVDDDTFGGRCFWVVRADGTRVRFSYRWCFEKHPSKEEKARRAFRWEIVPSVDAFKRKVFSNRTTVPCAVTGRPLRWDEGEVDHVPFFYVLRDEFLSREGRRLEDVEVQPWVEGESRFLFLDRALAASWIRFHDEHAHLQFISKEENQKKGGRG